MADGKSGRDETQKSERPEQGLQPEPTPLVAPDELHCPQCGGLAKRTWSDVSTFVLATFFISLMLTPVIAFVCMGQLGTIGAIPLLLCAGTALLSFWALPVMGALAVVARPCCTQCGHRFRLASDGSYAAVESPFPVRFAVVGSVILLAALVVGLVWFRRAPGQEAGTVGLTFFLRIVMAGFALGLGFLAQAILWRRMGARVTNTARHGLLLLLPPIVLGAGWLTLTAYDHHTLSCKYDPVTRSPQVLDRAGLAALPPSVRDVRVYSWAFMLSGQFTLRFVADPNDIEQFLAASPSLEGVMCRTYSTERMRLPARSYDDIFADVFDDRRADKHEYFDPNLHVLPDWYQKSIRGLGRRYEISWCDGKYQGELIIDDKDHTVYVHVSRY